MFAIHIYYFVYFFLLLLGFPIYLKKSFLIKTRLSQCSIDLDVEQILSFLKEREGTHVSHLVFLQDKEVYWACGNKILIIYKRIGNKFVVLGDPIGEEFYIQEAIQEFYENSERKGFKAIFYQTSPQYMQYYHETGYRFLKLGEEARVNLQTFSLEGKKGAKLRTRLNKFNRNLYKFSVIKPPYSDELISEIKLISDSWLGKQKEKGFSVVSFSEVYVSSFPIALLFDPNGNIIAFATLASNYKKTISIDLMRKTSDSPHGTMDVLFIHIFKWAKDKGYQTCSLGMAPLSNVGNCENSLTSEKIIRFAYQYGNSLYKFKGLKEFKGKFACSWEPKYLAFKKTFLPIMLIELLLLINTPPIPKHKVVGKIKYFFKRVG